ncbi:hypothetical protein STAS_10359 [Striga asiatica]|uniref:Uncharacterized protein n=1 Tax=Striga asiatica TaxID=4170 RepID=A0A5A7PNG3_STRAF|nr:hypothetical protein STAS_10359 [Striga asiatica]
MHQQITETHLAKINTKFNRIYKTCGATILRIHREPPDNFGLMLGRFVRGRFPETHAADAALRLLHGLEKRRRVKLSSRRRICTSEARIGGLGRRILDLSVSIFKKRKNPTKVAT